MNFFNFFMLLERLRPTGDWQGDVSWKQLYDWVISRTCDESRKTGHCSHPACERNMAIAEYCLSREWGENPRSGTIQDLEKLLYTNTCHDNRTKGSCGHRGCGYTQHLLDWVKSQEEYKKVA